MKKNNIIKTSTILLLTVLVISAFAIILITVQAQGNEIREYETFCFCITTPNPVGIGQETYIQFRIDKVSPTTLGESGGDHFTGFTVEITLPNGNTDTHGPFNADSTSGSWMLFTPTMIGDHTIKAVFPGQWINGTAASMFGAPITLDRWYEPSESLALTLTVQEDSIEGWPDIPLPSGYWERPVSAENKGWYQIMDNWLMPSYDRLGRMFHWSPAYAPYTSGPDSAHVLWTKQFRDGGMVGGQFEDESYYTGLAYEEPLPNKLILNGRLIYTVRTHGSDDMGAFSLGGFMYNYGDLGTRIVDLYTGEEIMYLEGTIIDFAQTVLYDSANQHGVTPHLWQSISGGYNVYDAFTGVYMFTINDVPGGTTTFGPKGEILVYSLGGGVLSMWNSTKAILTVSQPRWGVMVREEYYNIPIGAQVNGTLGLEWSVTVPDIGVSPSIALINVEENIILAASADSSVYPTIVTEVAYPATLNKGSSGNYPTSINHLWVESRQDVRADTNGRSENLNGGVYAAFDEGAAELFGYSAITGEKLWSTGTIYSEGLITFSHNLMVAYGKVILSGYDGHVRAFNAQTGVLEWDYYKGSAGYEVFYGSWPDYAGYTIADEKVYVSADDHSPEGVLWRGANLWCVDITNGDLLWKLPGMLRQPSIADGILVAGNSYDGLIYAVGKGPSKMTVTAPDVGIKLGDSLVIRGTVLDQSPGQPDTPCVSDESMGAWMGYIHQNKAMPSDATGVEIIIDVLDSNGNYRNIGTATSDLGGNFGFSWTPDIPGDYTVIATFGGTNSYGSSFATTYFTVDPATTPATPIEPDEPTEPETPTEPEEPETPTEPEEPEEPETPEEPTSEAPFITTEIAILAAVAVACVIGVVAFWALKKRK